MIYLLNSKLQPDKSVFFSLTGVYGIGRTTSFKICKKLGFSKNLLLKNLSEKQVNSLLGEVSISKNLINKDLRKFNSLRRKRLVSMKSYRGLRLKNKLPARGQRTHTNARTAKK